MRSLTVLTILCVALSTPAFADLYNNGPTNGNVNAWFIDFANRVSDSFQASVNATMTSFTFAEWVSAGNTPLIADWTIGTSSFGSNIASGNNTPLSSTIFCHASNSCGLGFYDVYNSTASVGDVNLSTGQTYWLTLTLLRDNQFSNRDAWDINSGPSQAYHDVIGATPSESFTINGTAATTPEPSSIVLFGTGILGLAGMLRRRLK